MFSTKLSDKTKIKILWGIVVASLSGLAVSNDRARRLYKTLVLQAIESRSHREALIEAWDHIPAETRFKLTKKFEVDSEFMSIVQKEDI